jgi:alpha-beta hydrolase superfamily lysophospholipase
LSQYEHLLYGEVIVNWFSLIAVSGLGSHAFGSFKEKKGSHMWLRDSLARDIPNMRILIYGYDTQMDGSTSFANLDDLANEFQERIKSIRSYPRLKRSKVPTSNPERPLILIGHSLGGIIIKAVCLLTLLHRILCRLALLIDVMTCTDPNE